jgi:hypothetical protein
MVRFADRLPDALGENVTEMVHEAPTASVLGPDGHVVVSAKSDAFVPPTAMFVRVKAAVPAFVSVTDCAGLVDPTT